MGGKRNSEKILFGEHERKIPLGRPRRRWDDNIRTDLRSGKGCTYAFGLGYRPEHGNERSVFVKRVEFLDYVNDYQLFKKNTVPWS
jgi:hypothetical protein